MKKTFAELLNEKMIILDGATGTNLQKRGMPGGVCPEEWIIEHKEVLIELQKAFIKAGSDIVYAPTFSGNRIKLAEYGLSHKVDEINQALVSISREAAGETALVAGDMTMTGQQLVPLGTLTFEALLDCYEEQAAAIAGAGVDVFVVETMMNLNETRAAVMAIHNVCDLPVMVTMTFEANGKTLYGTDGITALITLQSLGIDAFGINCSAGPQNLIPMLAAMRPYAQIPLIVKANAGLPEYVDGETVFSMNPEDFALANVELLNQGARIVGGCCGTTPEHIQALNGIVQAYRSSDLKTEHEPLRAVTNERRTWFFEDGFDGLKVNTTINASENEDFYKDLLGGEWDSLYDLMEEAEDDADIININVDAPDIDGEAVMRNLFHELPAADVPVSISSANIGTLESALIHFPGRALIYDISEGDDQRDAVLLLAKKYGAVVFR